MWQLLYNLLKTFALGIFQSAFPTLLRAMIWGATAYWTYKHADTMAIWMADLWTQHTSMTFTGSFSLYAAAFQITNAWMPVRETMIALAALWSFRAIHSALKVVEHVWDAVPFQ